MTETAKKLNERKAWRWTDPEAPAPEYECIYNPYRGESACYDALDLCRKYLTLLEYLNLEGFEADDDVRTGYQFFVGHIRNYLEHIEKSLRAHR